MKISLLILVLLVASSTATKLFASKDGELGFEAEDFDEQIPSTTYSTKWQLSTSKSKYSGTGAVAALPNSGINAADTQNGPMLNYKVYIEKAGTYYIWIRIYAPSSNDDSFHIGVDGVPLTFGGVGLSKTASDWKWVDKANDKKLSFQAHNSGWYTFNLFVREDGMTVDAFILSTRSNYKPTDNKDLNKLNIKEEVIPPSPPAIPPPTPPQTIYLKAIVRDFIGIEANLGNCRTCHLPQHNYMPPYSGTKNLDPRAHPDFEHAMHSGLLKNLVRSNLGSNRKPIFNAERTGTTSITSKERFEQWYNDVDGTNVREVVDIPFTFVSEQNGIARYLFDTNFFYPADTSAWGPTTEWGRGREGSDYNGCTSENLCHNFGFTTEIHTDFVYEKGQVFEFRGDDDVWVFIDGKLVVDLGGTHGPETASVNLDTLGLTTGETYHLDFFHAERHTRGSVFRIETSILVQEPTDVDDCDQTLPRSSPNWIEVSPCRDGNKSNPKRTCSDPNHTGGSTGTCDCFTGSCRCTQGYYFSTILGYCTSCATGSSSQICSGNGVCGVEGCICNTGWKGAACDQPVIVTTGVPTTAVPTTAIPTTGPLTTANPTTAIPTTAHPTTAIPTTAHPTTGVATTGKPEPTEPEDPNNPCPTEPDYYLQTTTTSTLKPTQSAWLHLNFQGGCRDIPKFKVTVEDLPNAKFIWVPEANDWADYNFNNYTTAYVQYPSSRDYTMLYDNEQLSSEEVDFVAFRLNLPQDTPNEAHDIPLDIRVNYEVDGIPKQRRHQIKVPIVASAGSFDLISPDPISVESGRAQWISFTFAGKSRLIDFRLSFANTAKVSFTYPTNGDGTYTSLYWDNQLDFDERDWAAARVIVVSNACGTGKTTCKISTTYTITWLTTDADGKEKRVSETRSITFDVVAPVSSKRDISDYTLVTSTIQNVPSYQSLYVLFSLKGNGNNLEEFTAYLDNVEDGLIVSYPDGTDNSKLNTGTLAASGDGYVPVFITAQEGTYYPTLHTKYKKDGQIVESTHEITLTVQEYKFQVIQTSLEVSSPEDSILVSIRSSDPIGTLHVEGSGEDISISDASVGGGVGTNVYVVLRTKTETPGSHPSYLTFYEDGNTYHASVHIIARDSSEPTKEEEPEPEDSNAGIAIAGTGGAVLLVAAVVAGVFGYRKYKASKVQPFNDNKTNKKLTVK